MSNPKASPQSLTASIRAHPGLILALLVYLLLALAYFFIVPIFEGPDEWTHTGHVKYIAEGNGLPVMLPGQGIWGGQQPPLYYAVGAVLVQPFKLEGVEDYEEHHRNPHASLGYALDPGNKNNYLHGPSENFPYRGLSLTVHLLRLYSMLYGLVTIVFIYLTAFEIYDFGHLRPLSLAVAVQVFRIYGKPASNPKSKVQSPKWFATAVALLVATQPMFAFITASVANEPANIAFCAIGLWLAQRYVLRGPSRNWYRAAALGVALGLISLSKMTGLAFGLVAVVAILIATVSTRKQPGAARSLWRDGIIIGLLFLAVGGWWYWRNYRLYGDFFQQGLYKIYFNVDPQPLTLSEFLYTLSTGEISFWATFGWLNIAAPEWVYSLYRLISRIGLLGLLIAVVSQLFRKFTAKFILHPLSLILPPALILHLLFPLVLAFSLTRLVATEGGLQGRQLLPALGSMAIVIMWGWWLLVPTRFRLPVTAGLLAVLFGVALWLPFGVVAPAYLPPPTLAEVELPSDLERLDWIYGDNEEIKLIGVEIGTEVVRPGERVPVTAYWQALKPMETDYSVFVHLFGRNQASAGQFNSYPGLGLRPTSTLEPGQIVADTYPVLVNGGSDAPSRLRVNVGLFDFTEPGRPGIQPVVTNGPAPPSPTVGQLKLIPAQWPPATAPPPVAEFNDHIWLNHSSLDNCQASPNPCRVTFEWLAQGRPSTDYTVFIQLWQNHEFVAGFDSPPLGNDYPTSMWEAGEVIIDPHSLDLSAVPPGSYQLLAGLYNFATGERLPATGNSAVLPDYAVDLGVLQID